MADNKKQDKKDDKKQQGPPQKSMDLFKQHAKPETSLPPDLMNNINEVLRRLRVLEERYSNVRKKLQLTEQNMIEDTNKITDHVRVLQTNMKDLKKQVDEVNAKMKILNGEITSSAQKRDLDMLATYVSFWEPMQFLRRKEAEQLIEDILLEVKSGRKQIGEQVPQK